MTLRHLATAATLLLALPAAAGAQPTLDDGARLFRARDYGAARTALEAVARANPSSAAAAYYLGRIALVNGDGAGAVSWLERATKLDQRNSQYFLWLGGAYGREAVHANKFRQFTLARRAKSALETAVSIAPDDVDARLGLLQFYVVAPGIVGGSTDKARQQAREIASRNAFRGHLAEGEIAEAKKDDNVAEREYRAAVAAAPDSAPGYAALGDFYRRTGRYDQAFATFEQMRQRLPDEGSALYFIGRTAAVSGQRLDDGARALGAYLAARPSDTDPPLASAHFRLGTIYQRQGKLEDARREYRATLALDPRQSEAADALKKIQ